ncbi:embryogenesis-associated protein EMB8 isoform X1 [Carex littledalei]|uniref:Embryogenesis-associated protein EMB8 isoform X1 n=1 Tax=Carex littledalei TaxID=544730 RepID=A0A833QHD5_9POAL|nr:embryogenesis-associated protein EMB8 isoform X1 [Carex littledalei]
MANPHLRFSPARPYPTLRRSLLPLSAMSSPSDTKSEDLPGSSLEIVGARRSLLSNFASLQCPYKAFPVLGWNRHVETIFAAIYRALPVVKLRRKCLRTKDDGAVALDWVLGDETELPFDSPVLILLPGLTGGSGDTYVRHMLLRARKKGWRVVVFNSRGCADSPVTTPKFYSASFTDDLCEVVSRVSTLYPKSKLYAVGWSLGANILVRYLGQESHNCVLSGAVSLCNPFNLPIADEDFHKGFNNVYDGALSRGLCNIFKKHALLFEGIGGEYNIPMVANARSVRDFDEGLTRVTFGFKSVDDYYYNSSSSRSIKDVSVPLLCIQAENDPIAPSRGIPREDIKENPNCLLIVTPKGGHLGWVAGDEAPFGCPWTDPVVMEFLEHLHNQGDEKTSTANYCSDELNENNQPSDSSVIVHIQQ